MFILISYWQCLNKGIKKLYASYDKNHSWYIVGDIFFKLGKYDQAVSAFKKALELWPEDKDAILALSNSFSENGQPEKAEKVLKNGLKIYKNDEAFIYNLANALFDQSKYKKAINYYKVIKDDDELRGLSKKNIKAANSNLKKSAKR